MFRVVWKARPFNRLGRFIAADPSRKAEFAAGLRKLTAELSNDPVGTGESRDPPYRFAVFRPFAVYFRPAPAERRVYVVRILLPRRR